MGSEQETAGLHVALMSYDERELRVRKFYLEEQSPSIVCTCFQSGEPALEALQQNNYDVLVLSGQLADMNDVTFLRKLNEIPNHPPLLLQGDGWRDDAASASLRHGQKIFCVDHRHLRDLLQGLKGIHSENTVRIGEFCAQLYTAWAIPQPDTNCGYLTLALQIACSSEGKLAIRKEILQGVADQYQVTVAAVDSGLRRLISGLETRAPAQWVRFKEENGLAGSKVTAGRLIYTLQQTVLRQGIIKWEYL